MLSEKGRARMRRQVRRRRAGRDRVEQGPAERAAPLLTAFVLIEQRTPHPLLPLQVVLDRNRGGSYLAMLLLGIATFGVFLFLTYYLQVIAGYSPVGAGLAFLPMVACVLAGSVASNFRLLPRFGPRRVVTAAAVLAGLAMLGFAQINTSTMYWGGVLAPGVVFGLGMGAMFGCCFNTATAGAGPQMAGVASAMVSVGQQVGGSIGASLLNTVAASTAATYLAAHASAALLAQHATTIAATTVWRTAQLHSYDAAFYIAAAFIFAAALGAAIVYPRHRAATATSKSAIGSTRIELPTVS